MANTFSSWTNPAALGPVLDVLRQNAVLPRLVRQNIGDTPATRGSTIDISYTTAATARDIASAVTPAGQPGHRADEDHAHAEQRGADCGERNGASGYEDFRLP